jgi:hypothetical protein
VTHALEHGYCTDDMARMLIVDLRQRQRTPSPVLDEALDRDLDFLEAAFSTDSDRFRNLRSTAGEWLDEAGTEDSHGRAIQGLGWAVDVGRPDLRMRAGHLLNEALPGAARIEWARPLAYVILGCLRASGSEGVGEEVAHLAHDAAQRLAHMTDRGDERWPWPEDVVTYDNGVIAQALIEAGTAIGRPEITRLGLSCLRWLLDTASEAGYLRPVGNDGWWPRGGAPARYAQQPIEVASLIEAAAAACRATGQTHWLGEARRAFAWFLGSNDLGIRIADPEDGSCQDGLEAHGVNRNRGAESTLAWLMSVETMARLQDPPG